jgi:sterol desaturase/sphingolipid hydroxylase (fatty acid hydroxylase superfamily)
MNYTSLQTVMHSAITTFDEMFSSPENMTLKANFFNAIILVPIIQVFLYAIFFFGFGEDNRPDFDYKQAKEQFKLACRDTFIISPIAAVAMYLVTNKLFGRIYYRVSDYGLPYLFISIPLYFIASDTFLYWGHRLLHTKWFWKYHQYHHRFKPIYTQTNGILTIPDYLLQGLQGIILPLYFVPVHISIFTIIGLFINVWSVYVHTQSAPRLPKNIVNSFFLDNGDHLVHHQTSQYNFSIYIKFWDWLCGTYCSETDSKVKHQ